MRGTNRVQFCYEFFELQAAPDDFQLELPNRDRLHRAENQRHLQFSIPLDKDDRHDRLIPNRPMCTIPFVQAFLKHKFRHSNKFPIL